MTKKKPINMIDYATDRQKKFIRDLQASRVLEPATKWKWQATWVDDPQLMRGEAYELIDELLELPQLPGEEERLAERAAAHPEGAHLLDGLLYEVIFSKHGNPYACRTLYPEDIDVEAGDKEWGPADEARGYRSVYAPEITDKLTPDTLLD